VVFARLRRRLFPRRRARARALETIADVRSPQLGNSRNITVYLPPSYDSSVNRHYPVVYMQDGQNLFTRETSFSGDWGLTSRLDALAAAGIEAILVGVWNAGDARIDEYSPFRDSQGRGGRGDEYLSFLTDTVKPLIDGRFQTRPTQRDTFIGGSSMGGLISLYAALGRSTVFGGAAVLSPSVWFADSAIVGFAGSAAKGGPVYLDAGARESDRQLPDVRRLRDVLRGRGYREGVDLMYEEDPGGAHNEAAWGRRFPRALAFLIGAERA
jgi:predicted alpha/beta superfamily hydrolase